MDNFVQLGHFLYVPIMDTLPELYLKSDKESVKVKLIKVSRSNHLSLTVTGIKEVIQFIETQFSSENALPKFIILDELDKAALLSSIGPLPSDYNPNFVCGVQILSSKICFVSGDPVSQKDFYVVVEVK